jgi:hypothetical protein
MPAYRACWWPKFREKSITRIRGSTAASFLRWSSDSSLEPSFTNIASADTPKTIEDSAQALTHFGDGLL